MAAETVPNIKPIIKIDIVFRILLAVMRTANKTNAAPKLEAIAIAQFERANPAKTPPKILEPKINRATPKLAPDEIPRTKGPAKGFLNKVCMSRPLIDKPEPTKIAVKALGRRKLKIIKSQLDLELFPPKRISKISEIGIETEPKLILTSNRISTNRVSPMNCLVYLFSWINRLKI